MTIHDETLVQACQRGDADAWEVLITRYKRLIYAIPRRAGLDQEQSTEVFQQVLTTLLEKLDVIEQPERIRAWLVTTTLRSTWRMKRRERMVGTVVDYAADDEEVHDIPDGALLPEDALVRIEEHHQVRTALGDMDERCRTLLTLLFYRSEPPPYVDIAAQLGVSEGSIGPTRARCLQKLLHILNERGF
jgi:RNA polymerase sigma factor (sigma-70 family)